jgi:hypothetical protein
MNYFDFGTVAIFSFEAIALIFTVWGLRRSTKASRRIEK